MIAIVDLRYPIGRFESPQDASPAQRAEWIDAILDALHDRWADLLVRLEEDDWQRSFVHPESGRQVPLFRNLALYAWHGRHHDAQIEALREREGW